MLNLADGPVLPRHRTVVLVVDLVESVSLMQADELGVIQRWQAFLTHVTHEVLPASGGRLVKSLGDGLMIEFKEASRASAAALAMHRWMESCCEPIASGERLLLRAGLHATDVYVDDIDIYGAGVNLAARIATLAGAGETFATDQARDDLADGIDARITDMGKCFLKHIAQPVHVYRIGPMGANPVIHANQDYARDLRPVVAVIPFSSRSSNEATELAVGDLIADAAIASLSHSDAVSVIARLSSAGLRDRADAPGVVRELLGADYALSGSYLVVGQRLVVTWEIVDLVHGRVVRSDRITDDLSDLLQPISSIVSEITSAVLAAVAAKEADLAATQPMPTLESYTLLLGGITLMHRPSRQAFDLSRIALDSVLERHRRASLPWAWLAKWHVMRVLRGISDDPRRDGDVALEQSKRALSLQPDSALCMAVEAFVHTHLTGDLDLADSLLAQAEQANSNEPYVWLFHSVLSSFRERNADSVLQALRAQRLSPRDPLRYFFDTILAAAYLANDEHDAAIQWANESLRLNSSHSPTLRVLTTAHFELGNIEQAQSYFSRLRHEEPTLTLGKYTASPNRETRIRQRCAQALKAFRLPLE